MDRRTALKLSGAGALAGLATAATTPVAGASPPSDVGKSWLMAKELVARGPNPEREDGLMLYGQFVGSWDAHVRELFGERLEYDVRWTFGWTLAGNAVQDVLGRVDDPGDRGTTIRVYDPAQQDWVVSWFGTKDLSIRHFRARQVGDEIHQTGADFEGSPMRWIFSQITATSFQWRNEIDFENNNNWFKVIEMAATRRI